MMMMVKIFAWVGVITLFLAISEVAKVAGVEASLCDYANGFFCGAFTYAIFGWKGPNAPA